MDNMESVPQSPSELHQLRTEVAEVKKLAVEIRRAQKRSTWLGVAKIVVYFFLLGGAALLLKNILPSGLKALTGSYDINNLPTTTTPNIDDIFSNLKALQQAR